MTSETASFSEALILLKEGARLRRDAWKPNKWIALRSSDEGSMSYLELVYIDGRRSPWTPTRCDLLECDWRLTS